MNYSAMLKR